MILVLWIWKNSIFFDKSYMWFHEINEWIQYFTQILQGNALFSGKSYTAGIFCIIVVFDGSDKFYVSRQFSFSAPVTLILSSLVECHVHHDHHVPSWQELQQYTTSSVTSHFHCGCILLRCRCSSVLPSPNQCDLPSRHQRQLCHLLSHEISRASR